MRYEEAIAIIEEVGVLCRRKSKPFRHLIHSAEWLHNSFKVRWSRRPSTIRESMATRSGQQRQQVRVRYLRSSLRLQAVYFQVTFQNPILLQVTPGKS